MVVTVLFVTTALLYAAAALLYLAHLARGVERLERRTHITLGTAVVSHVAFLFFDVSSGRGVSFEGIHGALAILSLATVIAFLLAAMRYRVAVLGAFVTPLALLFFLASGLVHEVAPVPSAVRSALLPFHIAMNVLGMVAFALAFGASTAYVLQDRKLRRKELAGIFRRLPSLDVLDGFSVRALSVGFPAFTAGVVTGTLWIVRTPDGVPHLSPAHFIGLVTWVVFASVIGLRVLAGWQGRRAALGTMLGFACAMVVLAIYVLRPELAS